ncbi:MAG TPA: A/G-specific adenine glycosylase [Usitatibacter sp.]|nr:A/G-specific adenine glycosylase [Usitatibacter sp.]
MTAFASRVVEWQATQGRHGLPWQGTRDAYRIWLSEIMLQQTQVSTVLGYFERFIARFPRVGDLALASDDEVMALWSGLGYYARARNLHRAARDVVQRFGGVFPARFEDLVTLPGIGRSTASAIAAFASGERRAILDGNVRRVLARHGGIAGDPSRAAVQQALWSEAESRLPTAAIEAYTQGMMDLGANVCVPRDPRCLLCPVNADCVARIEERVHELPGRKARAPARRKRISMLVVLRGAEVLLEKRAPSGIWGGLWSLPEAAADAVPAEVLAREWGLHAAEASPLQAFEHAFTHFTLEVAPWRIHLAAGARQQAARDGRPGIWLALDEVKGAALPSPVKKLLLSLK